jgi:hypothetical protein
LVVGGAFLVARGQAAALLATIDQALDAVAETVESSIKWTCTTFMALARDRDSNAVLASIAPNPSAAVAFVPQDAVRAALGTAWAPPLDGATLQELFKDHGLVLLARGQDQGHQLATPVGPQMDFGTEPAPAPAEGFGLWVPFVAPAAC